MDTFMYPEGDYSFLAEDEEILSKSCTVISIILYNQKVEVEYKDFSHFNFDTGKGIVLLCTLTTDEDLTGEGEEIRITRDCSLTVREIRGKKDFSWWKNGSVIGVMLDEESDEEEEWNEFEEEYD